MAYACFAGHLNGLKPTILSFFTIFTPFWGVLKLFVSEEYLLAGCPDELLGTVDAEDRDVVELTADFLGLDLGFPNLPKKDVCHNQYSVNVAAYLGNGESIL